MIEARLAGKFDRVIATLALREVPIDDSDFAAIRQRVAAGDRAPLGVLVIARKSLDDRQRLVPAQQGNALMSLLPMKPSAISHPLHHLQWKLGIRHLALLKAQHIRVEPRLERLQLMRPGTDSIDVE